MKLLLTMALPYTRVHGGSNRSNRRLAERLAARGHQLRVVVPALAEPSAIDFKGFLAQLEEDRTSVTVRDGAAVFVSAGVEIHAVAELSRLRSYLTEQIERFDPDRVLVSSEDPSQSLLGAALKASSSPVVYLAHTPQMFPFGPASLYPGASRTALIGDAAAIVAISEYVAAYIKQWAGYDVHVHHPPHYDADSARVVARRDGAVLLMNACAVKGISIFLALARRLPGARFAALPGYGTTAADRAALRAVPNVTLLQNPGSLDDLFAGTSVLLMPSLWVEGFGMAAVDAMLHGVPVLAAQHGGLTEAALGAARLLPVQPIERFERAIEDNALPRPVVPDQDVEPWRAALSDLLSREDLYARSSEAARARSVDFAARLDVTGFEELLRGLSIRRAQASAAPAPAPAPAGKVAASLAELSPQQRALLMVRLRKKAAAAPPIEPVARDRALPLSFAQQRLWFLEQLDAGAGLYNLPSALHVDGALDLRVLERCFDEVVRRHEILRTTFPSLDGSPRQIIAPPSAFALPIVDLTAWPEPARAAEVTRFAAREARRTFDLSSGPLLRVTALRLAGDAHVILVMLHHIIADGWSMGVLIREIGALYDAFSRGAPSPLPALPFQYADFAVWQRTWMQGELERQLAYWRERLRDLPTLDLPADRPSGARRTGAGGTELLAAPVEALKGLTALAHDEGVSLFMVLLAALAVLLRRWSGLDDIAVGVPIANRSRSDLEGLIGCFVNTLVFRMDLSGDPTFRELLARVRDVALGAYAHQDLPFERLVEELQPTRDMDRPPLFRALFVFQNAVSGPIGTPAELRLRPLTIEGGTAKFDLTFSMGETEHGLSGSIEYAADRFAPEMIRRMIAHLEIVVREVLADPRRRLSALSPLTDDEARQTLVAWNRTQADVPSDTCVHHLFEAQASRTPDAIAVVHGVEAWSYGELNARADQIARRLRAAGVGPEALVGVCVERSLSMIAALLGVLKAGGAYVPLDPAYPPRRLSFLASDAGLRVAIAGAGERPRAALHDLPLTILRLDDAPDPVGDLVGDRGESTPVSPRDLAYVLYTSGSTGVPKGVCIEHRSVVAFLAWAREVFEPDDLAGVLGSTSIGFDLSVFEIFLPLACGGTVVVVEDALRLGDVIHPITLVNTVPSVMTEVLALGPLPRSVRVVNLAGERLSAQLVSRLRAEERAPRVLDLYGPTECTTYATFATRDANGPATIGKPIANTRVYLLDRSLDPVPRGVVGELCIGGLGVARGYLGRARLTAERFIPDPFGEAPGERLYRTGDLARYLPDGRLELVGRNDHQIKLRGHRVELGEVEAALGEHPDVAEAAAAAHGDRLVGYVVAKGDAITAPALRAWLHERVQPYLVPSVIVIVDALPRTANGKLDRRKLPLPSAEPLRSISAPRTATEETIARIWEMVLASGPVGLEESFFERGGHSLSAVQVVSRIRRSLDVELPLRSIFEHPTVEGLAAVVDRLGEERHRAAPPIAQIERDRVIAPSFAQQRLWFLEQISPGTPAYNLPVAVRMTGTLDSDALCDAVVDLVKRHEVLRTVFRVVEGTPEQVILAAPERVVEVEDLSALSAEERAREAARRTAEEAAKPFSLSEGPLVRVRLVRLGASEHLVLFTMHHIVADGWSMGVLIEEVTELYAARTEGRPPKLRPLPIQYADYALWQRERMERGALVGEVAYWKQQLAGLKALELSTDRPRPAVPSARGAAMAFTLPEPLRRALVALGQQEGATLFMVLLAGFVLLLRRYTGQDDIAVGSPIAGRTRSELEGLIGFFVNTVVLRTRLEGEPTVREVIRRVRESALGAYAHQEVPFERLVEELEPERSLSQAPLFQVMFGLQTAGRTALRLGELKLDLVGAEHRTTKFDLTLSMVDGPDGLNGVAEYSTDLFEAATIRQMLMHAERVLEAMAANADQRISALAILTEAELARVEAWNRTERASRAPSVVALIEAQAAARPEALAVQGPAGEQLNYGALNQWANRVAQALRERGVGSDIAVGVWLERSAALPVAMVSVLKAGGAYVPLDPSLPRERLAYMARDAGVTVIVSERRLRDREDAASPWPNAEIVCLEDWQSAGTAAAVETNPAHDESAETLAYVMYTSGSTGTPRGVMVPRCGLDSLAQELKERFGLGPEQRVLLFASPSFDASVWEMLMALTVGASLHPVAADVVLSGEAFVRFIEERQITAATLPPSYVDALPDAELGSLRLLVVAGEACPPGVVRRWGRGRRLVNAYGPTEATICAGMHDTNAEDEREGMRVPIGLPIGNVQMYVLDGDLSVVPVGVRGELYLGGAGLARGYRNRPDWTAERFVPNPWRAGERLYRTGDLARVRPDGAVEFLGRADAQVKLRGHRVELGEIEAVLRAQPEVTDAAVLVSEGRLWAWAQTQGDVNGEALRERLRQALPAYMIPGAVITAASLPRTPSGKIDRRALLRHAPAPEPSVDPEAPRSATEQAIASVWAQVLGLECVGLHDNFFELGGHSLAAMRVVSRLRELHGIELPLRALFERPTIAQLSAVVTGSEAATDDREVGEI